MLNIEKAFFQSAFKAVLVKKQPRQSLKI